MMTLTAEQINAELVKFAKKDIRTAQKHGQLLIGQTKRGLLSLTRTEDGLLLTVTGLKPEVLAEGKPAKIIPVLVSVYDVVFA